MTSRKALSGSSWPDPLDELLQVEDAVCGNRDVLELDSQGRRERDEGLSIVVAADLQVGVLVRRFLALDLQVELALSNALLTEEVILVALGAKPSWWMGDTPFAPAGCPLPAPAAGHSTKFAGRGLAVVSDHRKSRPRPWEDDALGPREVQDTDRRVRDHEVPGLHLHQGPVDGLQGHAREKQKGLW